MGAADLPIGLSRHPEHDLATLSLKMRCNFISKGFSEISNFHVLQTITPMRSIGLLLDVENFFFEPPLEICLLLLAGPWSPVTRGFSFSRRWRMESPSSSGSDFEAVSSHLHSLQGTHDLLQQRVLHLEERIRALEDERPSVQARLSWIEQFLQRLRQCFQ